MSDFKETSIKVFGLMIIPLAPTCVIYFLFGEFIKDSILQGEWFGATVSLTGPAAFYFFIILLFKNWAMRGQTNQPTGITVNQEDAEAMSEDEKIRRLYQINAEIEILTQRRDLFQASLNAAAPPILPNITEIQVDADNIRGA